MAQYFVASLARSWLTGTTHRAAIHSHEEIVVTATAAAAVAVPSKPLPSGRGVVQRGSLSAYFVGTFSCNVLRRNVLVGAWRGPREHPHPSIRRSSCTHVLIAVG